MDPKRWAQVKDLFHAAMERPSGVRNEFLLDACRGDASLRVDVASLLSASYAAHTFLKRSPEAFLATVEECDAGAPRQPILAPGSRLGAYEVDCLIGAGGMGSVYLARHLALGRSAALKLIGKNVPSGFGLRLRREGEALARLQHPAIATLYEVGEADGTTFIAMEFVKGPTLRELLRSGPLSSEQALAVTASLLEALTHAHAAGVIHRDIKPENIIVTGPLSAKLLDFGIALPFTATQDAWLGATGDRLTAAGEIVGTPGYLSPEQVRAGLIDARSDLFSLAAVCYEALTGTPAFHGATVAERLEAVVSQDPEPFRIPEISPELWLIVSRALSREPAGRYPSARAFLSDLQRVTAGEAAAGLPDTLAIVDFVNLGGAVDVNWIGSGMAESLAAQLDGIEGLTVVPRARVLRIRAALEHAVDDPVELGTRLGCRWVLSGSYQSVDRSLRLTARERELGT